MRRSMAALAAALLLTSAAPVVATEGEEIPADEPPYERVDVPETGLSIAFPAGWRVLTPSGLRVSEIQDPEGGPVYVTTAVLGRGDGGRWCDVDVYLDMPAPLEEHAYAYARYLQQIHGPDFSMIVSESDLPAGPSFQLYGFDPVDVQVWAMYLLDGPVEDGQVDRYLLTCVAEAQEQPDPYWEAVAA